LQRVVELARANGTVRDAVLRQRLARAWIGLRVMRYNALRTLTATEAGTPGPEASITKLYWATWHRALGNLAVDVLGADALVADGDPSTYALSDVQRAF